MFFKAFTRLFRRELAPVSAVAELVRDLGRVESFPTLSDTTVRAMALTNDPRATIADLGELVRRDGVLAVAVLKVVNSAAYRGGRATENVQQAVVRLGMRRCQQVIAAVGVRGVFRYTSPQVAAACEGLLRHALFTATLATRLNGVGHLGFRGEEFTAGLLHDIGRVIVCVRAPDAFAQADPMTFQEDDELLARERAVLPFDHCELGARFAVANQLPRAVTNAILNHHVPEAERDHPLLVALTAASDRLANHVQRERKLNTYHLDECPGFVQLRDLAGADALKPIRKSLPTAVVDALRETRALLRIAAG